MLVGDTNTQRWLETGVPQLDQVLGGGLERGALVMIVGRPGAGKTTLAQQIAFCQAGQGRRVLFVSGYSETHDKLLNHARGLSFFKRELIGSRIQLVSLLDLLEQGADQAREAIMRLTHAQRATLVVVDGFAGMSQLLGSQTNVLRFLYTLSGQLAVVGATILVVVERDPESADRDAELSVGDVILGLRTEERGGRRRRLLEVMKARGAAAPAGAHPFRITADGLVVFPRWESVVAIDAAASWTPERAAFGIDGVDRMLGGGPNIGTITLAAGTPGVGKTLLGLHFASEGARLHEPVLFVTFVESAAQLHGHGRVFGMNLEAAEAAGWLRLLVLPAHDIEADQVAQLVSDDVERRQTRRLVIDSMAELDRGIGDPQRRPGFLSALVSYLRSRQVTTYTTIDLRHLAGPAVELADLPLSLIAENLLLMRSVEYQSRLHRVFSVVKMRYSDHERAIYDYTVEGGKGIRLLGRAPLGEGLLTGAVRPSADTAAEPRTG
ncbi:MAG: AAA family ATPase [Chloroflexi bacterium]|nr:AAA family ATPase [Chloroflexota bacterium]